MREHSRQLGRDPVATANPERCALFFVSDVEPFITERAPALWVHGHSHDSAQYRLGPTRVVANPFGYPHERNTGFDRRLTVELPEFLDSAKEITP